MGPQLHPKLLDTVLEKQLLGLSEQGMRLVLSMDEVQGTRAEVSPVGQVAGVLAGVGVRPHWACTIGRTPLSNRDACGGGTASALGLHRWRRSRTCNHQLVGWVMPKHCRRGEHQSSEGLVEVVGGTTEGVTVTAASKHEQLARTSTVLLAVLQVRAIRKRLVQGAMQLIEGVDACKEQLQHCIRAHQDSFAEGHELAQDANSQAGAQANGMPPTVPEEHASSEEEGRPAAPSEAQIKTDESQPGQDAPPLASSSDPYVSAVVKNIFDSIAQAPAA